jgi:hypothetical protein
MKNILKNSKNGTALFLGRVTNFTDIELTNFLEEHGLKYANRYENQDDIVLVILSSMLTPLEEQISYDLYDMGLPDVTLAKFEEYLTSHIKPNSLIMSLKLSNDQDRLKRLLKNEAFSDEVYIKLFGLYNWHGKGVHESDDNRDITITFVKRFYRPDGFRDPAMIYAPTTLMNIAQDTKDSILLDTMLDIPNHKIKISQRGERRPKSLRELIAFNEHLSKRGIKRLLGFNNSDINYFLASNSALGSRGQMSIFNRADIDTKMMLAHNSNLSDTLFEELLRDDEEIVKTLLSFQILNIDRLEMVVKKVDREVLSYIGYNPTAIDVIDLLLDLRDKKLDFGLSSNSSISTKYLKELYNRYGRDIAIEICKNQNISKEMAEEFYRWKKRDIIKTLAQNISTPKKILDELCKLNDRELNMLLASNSSVSLYYLQQFQLDPSLIMILAKNETYGKNVLNSLGI